MPQLCPLCHERGEIFYENKEQLFYNCSNCYGIFRAQESRLDPALEKRRYELHNNDIDDVKYQNFVSPITTAILRNNSSQHFGLDFGAGTGPVISKVLNDNQYKIDQYDPYFHNKISLLGKKYDYIVCCEVMEHFYDPEKEFDLLHKLLLPKGALYCMTELYNDSIEFSTWYYKNDPTHVFLYRKETLDWIKFKFCFAKVSIENRLIILFK